MSAEFVSKSNRSIGSAPWGSYNLLHFDPHSPIPNQQNTPHHRTSKTPTRVTMQALAREPNEREWHSTQALLWLSCRPSSSPSPPGRLSSREPVGAVADFPTSPQWPARRPSSSPSPTGRPDVLQGAHPTSCISDPHSPINNHPNTPHHRTSKTPTRVTMQDQVREPNKREWHPTQALLWLSCWPSLPHHHQVQQVARQCWLSSREPVGAVADFPTNPNS